MGNNEKIDAVDYKGKGIGSIEKKNIVIDQK